LSVSDLQSTPKGLYVLKPQSPREKNPFYTRLFCLQFLCVCVMKREKMPRLRTRHLLVVFHLVAKNSLHFFTAVVVRVFISKITRIPFDYRTDDILFFPLATISQ
jgi:hypothetical protein